MTEWRMPQPGEGWRHYKGGYPSLYEIVGIAPHSETGKPMVIYKPYNWQLAQKPPMYVRPLGVFLMSIKTENGHVPRFKFERDAEDPST